MNDLALMAAVMQDTAIRHLLFVVFAILILAAMMCFIVALGERVFGFNIKGAIDAIESAAHQSDSRPPNVWPITLLLLAGIIIGGWITVAVISG